MKNCQSCKGCKPGNITNLCDGEDFALVGNLNVGKSTIHARMKGRESSHINIPGTTVSIKRGTIKGTDIAIFDTPGIYSIFSNNEDERASRDLLLFPKTVADIHGIILVADAKNLKRSIAIALQYAEYGLPMIFNINMLDEGSARGIEIDTKELSNILGVEVFTTIATSGMGIQELIAGLTLARPSSFKVPYPQKIETYLDTITKLITSSQISPRAIGLLLLTEDFGIKKFIREKWGNSLLEKLEGLAVNCRREVHGLPENTLGNVYNLEAAKITSRVTQVEPPSRNQFILTFGDMCTRLSTGIPIALGIITIMYIFVGSFGATFLVDSINGLFFEGFLTPLITKLIAPIPSEFIKDMIVDPDFGVLPTGVFLALGLVLPVILCFYLAFGVLESSGYLSRISLLLDRIFQKMGLNGKGVIPLVMGFSCVTMAILTTRMLNTEKEKNIASFLLFLCMPCAPLIAVMLIILDKMPLSATLFVFGTILSQIIIAGYLANKIIPGQRTQLIMEIPTMRVPKPWPILKMSVAKSYFFMKEAIPVFIFASLAVFIFQRLGGLELLENSFGPIIGKVMGLPEKSIQVFIKTMIRRESGATELEHLSAVYTNLQLVVNLIVMTFLAPCLNSIIVLFKERGSKAASVIMITVVIYAITLGGFVNHFCRWFGISFT